MTNPVLAKLIAHNAGQAERAQADAKVAFLAPHKAKAELARAAGETADSKRISNYITQIYDRLRHEDARVELVPAKFFDSLGVGELSSGEFYKHGDFGWTPAQLKLPHDIRLTWKEQYTELSKWRSAPNGKLTLHVGGYSKGDAAGSFQTLKDGTMKYYEIASTIARCIRAGDAKAKAEAVRRGNQSTVVRVSEATNHQGYSGVSLSSSDNPDAPVYVKLDKTLRMTEERAIELLKVLKEFGIG